MNEYAGQKFSTAQPHEYEIQDAACFLVTVRAREKTNRDKVSPTASIKSCKGLGVVARSAWSASIKDDQFI
jgi:hypothetical protein